MTERENLLAYLKSGEYDHKPRFVALTGPDMGYIQHIDVPICERPMSESGYDVFGVHWTKADPASHYTPNQKPIISDIECWREEVRFPKAEKFDWDYVREEAKKLDRDKYVIAATLLSGPFERTTTLTSFEDCLANAITEPEAYAALVGAVADYKIAVIERLADAAHPDVINLHDDWGTSVSQFMSPALWRETIKPHTKRIYDACKARGMLVCQHSCGSLGPLVEDMVEMGADMWEAQDACNDIPALEKKYAGRLRLIVTPKMDEMAEIEKEGGVPPWVSRGFIGYDEKPEFLYE